MDISVCSDVSQLNESAEINVCRLPSEPNKATPQQFLESSAINRFVHSAGLVLGVSSNENYSSFVCTRVCVWLESLSPACRWVCWDVSFPLLESFSNPQSSLNLMGSVRWPAF